MAIDPKAFKACRKALGLTQQQLAKQLGLSRVTVNKMEKGKLRRGISDEIGAKLLALNAKPPMPNPFAGATTKSHLDEAHEFVTGHPVDDSDAHLWDNEEDES